MIGTITVVALAASGGNNNIQVAFKKYAPVTNRISEINNTQIDHDKNINVVMPMSKLIQ